MGIPAQALTALTGKAAPPKPKAPLVRVGTQFFREVEVGKGDTKQVVLVPVDVEVNLDPLEVAKAAGIGLAVAVVGGLVAYVAWEGLTLGTPLGAFRVIEGLKDTPFWKDEADRAQKALLARRTAKAAEEAQKLPQQCEDARVGLAKLRNLLAGGSCAGDPACEASMKRDIATLEAFIAANCG